MAILETSLPETIDRISFLPKPLISHILSLLPTKYSVATSILSTRWRFLWTSITNLDFDYVDGFNSIMKREMFTQFVNRVLLLLSSPCIQNFHLKYRNYHCDPFLDLWICAALGRTAHKLDLDIELATRPTPMELPFSHFSCETLVVLKLNGSFRVNIAASSSSLFPNLQTLHLSKVEFTIASDSFPSLKELLLQCVVFASLKELMLQCVVFTNEDSANILLASCPVLDNLVIDRCGLGNICCLVISIRPLKSLQIIFDNIYKDRDGGCAHKLRLDTPALTCLDLVGLSMGLYISAENLYSLVEARLRFNIDTSLTIDGDSDSANIFKLIPRFNMKFLSISEHKVKAIGSMSANIIPSFSNSSRLEIDINFCKGWDFVVDLLDKLDNLEHLVLKGSCHGNHEPWWKEPSRVPMCLLQRLSSISFTSMIGGCSSKLELARYFLKNAKVLQQLTVHVSGSSASKFKLIQKISMMPRGSQTCKVAFEGLETKYKKNVNDA